MFNISKIVFQHDFNFTDAEHLTIQKLVRNSESYEGYISVCVEDFSVTELSSLEDTVYSVCQDIITKRTLSKQLNIKEEKLNMLGVAELQEFRYLYDKYKHLLNPEDN